MYNHAINYKSVICFNEQHKYICYTVYKNASTKIIGELKKNNCIKFDGRIKYRYNESQHIENENEKILKNIDKKKI